MASRNIDDYSFEEFLGRRARTGSLEPRAGIYRTSGVIFLNKAAVDAMGNPKRLTLLYDAKKRVLGVRGCESGAHSYPLGRQKASTQNFSVSAVSFIKYCGLPLDRTLVWEPATVADDGTLVLPLDEAERRAPRPSLLEAAPSEGELVPV